jgi:hypothetical protein
MSNTPINFFLTKEDHAALAFRSMHGRHVGRDQYAGNIGDRRDFEAMLAREWFKDECAQNVSEIAGTRARINVGTISHPAVLAPSVNHDGWLNNCVECNDAPQMLLRRALVALSQLHAFAFGELSTEGHAVPRPLVEAQQELTYLHAMLERLEP